MNEQFVKKLFKEHKTQKKFPAPDIVCNLINTSLEMLFPELSNEQYHSIQGFQINLNKLKQDYILMFQTLDIEKNPSELAQFVFDKIPEIKEKLEMDAQSIYEGDPAAYDIQEVKRSYPGFYAIAVYRFAHMLHQLQIPYIPRILTEYAHSKTGVEIHPNAKIGSHFCIDHGTGIVIGETVTIGSHVKLYQGVTLGALSVDKSFASTKRHPTIEDGVIIYSGATILGGNTVIGENSIIGGNVWLTKSVEPGSKIYYQPSIIEHSDSNSTSIS
ncbi:serine O-acetyltransferase [Membranihabitans maritimus]|uniref:serine O-acetyltransferase n=1 Tax=Membranihabitans maritimus TaxID=2904244 RepID=UPI001F21324D|nr:serine O-acetyltransferase [Membranihabitans maritimus]